MSFALAFWILMLLWLFFGFWTLRPAPGQNPNYLPLGGNLLLFILLAILGWHAFGAPIHQ